MIRGNAEDEAQAQRRNRQRTRSFSEWNGARVPELVASMVTDERWSWTVRRHKRGRQAPSAGAAGGAGLGQRAGGGPHSPQDS